MREDEAELGGTDVMGEKSKGRGTGWAEKCFTAAAEQDVSKVAGGQNCLPTALGRLGITDYRTHMCNQYSPKRC